MKMMMTMMRAGLLLLGLSITSAAAAGPGSCQGRCGEVFTRGRPCSCDFGCLQHNECCPDFQATCVSARSCQGRCGEAFRRGQACECDPMCVRFSTCCPDYQMQCDAAMAASHQGNLQPLRAKPARNRKSEKNRRKSNSESEESYTGRGRCPQYPGAQCPHGLTNLLTDASSGSAPQAVPTNHMQHGGRNVPVGLLPMPIPSSADGAPPLQASGPSLPGHGSPALGSGAPARPSPAGAAGRLNVQLLLSSAGVRPSEPHQGVPAGTRTSTLQDLAQALGLAGGPAGPEGPGLPAAADLCSDAPISALASLLNGTVLIFKGELFWAVDPVSGSVGAAQNMTDSLSIAPPIDAVFTRSACDGDVYIIKGEQMWRLDGNMVMQPGFPKPLASEFPGLTGGIRAALAAPATRTKPERVFFFKHGDALQTFSFPPGGQASCREKPRSSSKSLDPSAEGSLSAEISISLSLEGFPTPVTAALSVPGPPGGGTLLHFVFSGPLFFRVQLSGDLPSLAEPDPTAVLPLSPLLSPTEPNGAGPAGWGPGPTHPPNSIPFLLRCP